MTVSLADLDISCDRLSSEETHDVMCLVKRHAYELAFAVPHAPHVLDDGAQPRLHIHVKRPCQAGGFALNLEDVERFYEDLLQMLEYLQNERQRTAASKPV